MKIVCAFLISLAVLSCDFKIDPPENVDFKKVNEEIKGRKIVRITQKEIIDYSQEKGQEVKFFFDLSDSLGVSCGDFTNKREIKRNALVDSLEIRCGDRTLFEKMKGDTIGSFVMSATQIEFLHLYSDESNKIMRIVFSKEMLIKSKTVLDKL